MIEIIAHRGFWKNESEKNQSIAFERAFQNGFGVETDVRDCCGEIVISHDPPTKNTLMFSTFLELYISYSRKPTLALNIKSDGLASQCLEYLQKYKIQNYFVFDMSIPDMLWYKKQNIPFFVRQSEYEKISPLYEYSEGVWLDEFEGHWISEETIKSHIGMNKKVCIVSPELHHRTYEKEWEDYRQIVREMKSNRIMICTDFPLKAKEKFI
jgi:glycerophosphoryl diester phosphodiesterase